MQRLLAFHQRLQSTIVPQLRLASATIQEIPKAKIEERLKAAVNQVVDSAGAVIKTLQNIDLKEIPKAKIEEALKASVNQIVDSAGAIIKTLQNIDSKEFQDRLESELSRVKQELQNEFSEPLPEDKTERYKRQETIITQAIEKIEDAIVNVCSNWKIPEDTVRADFGKVKPHLTHFLLIIGKQRRRVILLFRELTKDD